MSRRVRSAALQWNKTELMILLLFTISWCLSVEQASFSSVLTSCSPPIEDRRRRMFEANACALPSNNGTKMSESFFFSQSPTLLLVKALLLVSSLLSCSVEDEGKFSFMSRGTSRPRPSSAYF